MVSNSSSSHINQASLVSPQISKWCLLPTPKTMPRRSCRTNLNETVSLVTPGAFKFSPSHMQGTEVLLWAMNYCPRHNTQGFVSLTQIYGAGIKMSSHSTGKWFIHFVQLIVNVDIVRVGHASCAVKLANCSTSVWNQVVSPQKCHANRLIMAEK